MTDFVVVATDYEYLWSFSVIVWLYIVQYLHMICKQ